MCAGVFFTMLTPIFSTIPKLENIRVALLIKDKDGYFSTPPAIVTLTGNGGMDVAIRDKGQQKVWLSYPQDTPLRVSLNRYGVRMLDTTDFQLAKSLSTKLMTISKNTYISKEQVGLSTRYFVNFGNFANLADATTARDNALKNNEISSLVNGQSTKLTGPFHWQIANFPTETQAQNQANVLRTAGIVTNVVLQENTDGTLRYKLWLGNEATISELELLKQLSSEIIGTKKIFVTDSTLSDPQVLTTVQDTDGNKVYVLGSESSEPQLQAVSNVTAISDTDEITSLLDPADLTFSQADTASAYIIEESDVTLSADGSVAQTHLIVGSQAQKTQFIAKQPGITVKEKSQLTYRGQIEISAYRNELAVINELPFEEYLYGVVGSELSSNFPLEALKAQAVAARTYAITKGNKYEIANISDTTYDQAYYGMRVEFPNSILAATSTSSEVIVNSSGNLINPLYSSNAGGLTAVGTEVWGYAVSYLASVPSPDEIAAVGKTAWYNVRLTNGLEGYVRSDFLADTKTVSEAGIPIYRSVDNGVNVRLAPYVDNVVNPSIAKLALNEQVLMLGRTVESNNYNWIRGPYDEQFIIKRLATIGFVINAPINSLEVTKAGVSGRVLEVKVNGQLIPVKYPDYYRTVFGSLPSTKFTIKQVASYLDTPITGMTLAKKQFLFIGNGYGHGLGMSQWGAKSLAESGKDYKMILQHYYQNVEIVRNE
jgi:stage II sporulation protein D